MKKVLRPSIALFLLVSAGMEADDSRAKLLPNLQPAETLTYLIRFQSDKNVKTESSVAAPMAPNATQMDTQGLLRIEILDIQPAGNRKILHARAKFLTLDSGVGRRKPGDGKPSGDKERTDLEGKSVEFTISADGSIGGVEGLDSFLPEQQQAWQEWAARFALAWTFPVEGVKLREKWKSEQPERAEVPIAGLYWERETVYVQDVPCRPTQLSDTGEVSTSNAVAEVCAAILTTANLKQKSSSRDATPEDFKLHDLRTKGTAKGTNETITYISLRTGLVVRATEDAQQFMDVVVAMADGSNRVHYNVGAASHSEVLLVK